MCCQGPTSNLNTAALTLRFFFLFRNVASDFTLLAGIKNKNLACWQPRDEIRKEKEGKRKECYVSVGLRTQGMAVTVVGQEKVPYLTNTEAKNPLKQNPDVRWEKITRRRKLQLKGKVHRKNESCSTGGQKYRFVEHRQEHLNSFAFSKHTNIMKTQSHTDETTIRAQDKS